MRTERLCPVCHPLTAPFQLFWRCEHHPSALENFAALRSTCDFECHTQDLKWHHGGVHPTPKSWPAAREGSRSAIRDLP